MQTRRVSLAAADGSIRVRVDCNLHSRENTNCLKLHVTARFGTLALKEER